MSYDNLTFTQADGVAVITLNRPEAANAIDLALAEELMDAASRCDDDDDVRAVIVTGTGRFFSAGGDLKDFLRRRREIGVYLRKITTHLHAAIARFHRMDAPVIMAVGGIAAGGGFSLAIAGDLVVAAKSAKLTMGYSSIGLCPDGTSTYFLPRLVGLRRAQELALTDRMLTADEAHAWGLVTTVVPDEELMPRVQALAARIARGPTRAFGRTKRLLASAFTTGLETQAELETRSIGELSRTADGVEGITAFIEKRKPTFRGA